MTEPAASFWRKPPLGVIMLIAMILLAVFGPLFVAFNPAAVDTSSRLLAPLSYNRNGAFFLLGTDVLIRYRVRWQGAARGGAA